MAFEKTAVGIELGTHALKAVEVRVAGREARIERSATVPRSALAHAAADAGAMAERLAEEMARLRIRRRGVVLAISAQDVIMRYSHVPPMPAPRLALIMKYEVESVGERMGEQLASGFRVLPVLRADGEQTVLLGLAKEGPLTELLDALEAAGITVASAVPAPLALYGAWELFGEKADLDAPDDDLVLAADLGRTSLHIALILNNRLVFARSATFGGEQFTEVLAKELRISRDDAEKLKIRRGAVQETRGSDARVVGPLRTTAGQLLGFVQSSIRFGQSQTGVRLPAVTRLWLTGGGMRLAGLAEYLASALGNKPCQVFDPPGPDPESEGGAGLALALGLSAVGLQGPAARGGTAALNILPEKYAARRRFRERTRYLWAAAAMLLALVVARFVEGTIRGNRAQEVHREFQSLDMDLARRAEQRNAWNATASRTRARIDRLLREAELTTFQAFMLDFLSRNLRPEIQLELVDIEVERVEQPDASSDNRYVLVIRGRVNNENRRGHDLVLELQSRIQQEDRVREVRFGKQPRSDDSAWYGFEMVVEPQYMVSS